MSKITNQTFRSTVQTMLEEKAKNGVTTITGNDFEEAKTKAWGPGMRQEIKAAFGDQWTSLAPDAKQAYLQTVDETTEQQFPRTFPCSPGKVRCFQYQPWAKNAENIKEALPTEAKTTSQMSDLIAGNPDVSKRIIELAYTHKDRGQYAKQGYGPALHRLEYGPNDTYVATLRCEHRGNVDEKSGRKLILRPDASVIAVVPVDISQKPMRSLSLINEY